MEIQASCASETSSFYLKRLVLFVGQILTSSLYLESLKVQTSSNKVESIVQLCGDKVLYSGITFQIQVGVLNGHKWVIES